MDFFLDWNLNFQMNAMDIWTMFEDILLNFVRIIKIIMQGLNDKTV